ncbi:MAG: hypothetical protein ACL7BU_09515 [Candidatus Phlomobacter fragariae]
MAKIKIHMMVSPVSKRRCLHLQNQLDEIGLLFGWLVVGIFSLPWLSCVFFPGVSVFQRH